MAAGLGFKDFVTGEVLTAADVDGYLMQGIWVFDDAAARDAAVTSPEEGNACYLKDTNEVLTYSGSVWVAVGGGSPLTTKGDLYGFSTVDARIPIGANDTVLTADSTQSLGLKWAAPAAGGGMTLITTTTFDNTVATYTYSSLGSYKHLMIVIDNMTRNNASSVDSLVMQFNGVTSGTPYDSIAFGTNNETFAAASGYNAGNYLLLGWRSIANTTAGTGERGQVAAWIYDYAGSTKKTYNSICRMQDTSNHRASNNIGMWDSTSAITSITIFTQSTDNFNTGTLKLYGVS
jgi:hypothetical protein